MSQTSLALIKIGTRSVSVRGFTIEGAIEHLKDHLVSQESWCQIGCMANTMLGRNSEANRSKIRRYAHLIFKTLLSRGVFLVISYDPSNHGRIAAMKLYQGGGKETDHALLQLERMLKRKQLTNDLFDSAKALIGS